MGERILNLEELVGKVGEEFVPCIDSANTDHSGNKNTL